MARLPLLLFPQARRNQPSRKRGFPLPEVYIPNITRQKERLGPAFQRLEDAFEARRAELSTSVTGMEPEKVLVIETVGPVGGFQRAVQAISGLEWLGEFETYDIDPDDDFYYADKPNKKIPTTLYLAMTDERAIREIISLWNSWESDRQKISGGKTKWRDLFKLCRIIRYWNVEDRLSETGLIQRLEEILSMEPENSISMEIEFWPRAQKHLLMSQEERIVNLLNEEGGEVITTAHIPEIFYNAIKVRIPTELAKKIVHNDYYPNFFNEDAIYYLCPTGQCNIDLQDVAKSRQLSKRPLPEAQPVVAILDGAPFQSHQLLRDRIELDDPQDFAGSYQVGEQKHGTAMASLVIHGELDDNNGQALTSKVYMRPVMKPKGTANGQPNEEIPEDMLLVDLVHQSVKEIFERDDGKDFSTIKVINVSLGDSTRPFNRILSPWARLLDWLSWKYRVLFCVSAGNFSDELDLGITPDDFAKLNDNEKSQKTISSMANKLACRRLLSPAESMNAITVGSLHHDLAGQVNLMNRIDLQPYSELPSPINRLGSGFRNSVKPDILMPGGRQLYMDFPPYKLSNVGQAPGQSVASPGKGTGQIDRTTYTRGTSNATALASRGAARIHEALKEIRGQDQSTIPNDNMAVLMKALLVHGARWDDALDKIKTPNNLKNFKRYASRFLGYGGVNIERVLECTELRVTMIGTDSITANKELEYRFPLPPSLSGSRTGRRLTITLAWFTPINPAHRNLRQAMLSYAPPKKEDHLHLSRKEADWQQVKKGTVQHEILEGNEASVYQDGDELRIAITCKEDASGLGGVPIPFGLAVTLEVLDEVKINIYNEIRDRIRTTVEVPVRAS